MKSAGFIIIFLFVAAASWGLYGFGGETLPEQLARQTGIPFRAAALAISLAVTLLGGVGLLLWGLARRSVRGKKDD